MALLLLSSRSLTRAGVRAVSLHGVLGMAAAACLLVGCLAFAAGLALGRQQATSPVQADAERDGFAVQRLGEISARIMALEGNASGLLKKLSGIEQIQGSLYKLDKAGVAPPLPPLAPSPRPKDAAGGPELAPVCDISGLKASLSDAGAESVKRAEGSLNCLQSLLQHIDEKSSPRSVAYMALPNRIPVPGAELGSPFGNRVDPITGHLAFHPGLDFRAEPGTPIYSAGGGTVRFAGWHNEFGNVLEIDHGNGLISRYAHASRLLLKEGDIVVPGQQVAAVGSTGRSTGPHLHFEIIRDGRYIDPMQYLSSVLPRASAAPQS
jgi:murein DD-endopeptidase MepM/ murein hydrolase activator NlpD